MSWAAAGAAARAGASRMRVVCMMYPLSGQLRLDFRLRRSAPRRRRRPAASRSSARSCPAGTGFSVSAFRRSSRARPRSADLLRAPCGSSPSRRSSSVRFSCSTASVSGVGAPAFFASSISLKVPSRSPRVAWSRPVQRFGRSRLQRRCRQAAGGVAAAVASTRRREPAAWRGQSSNNDAPTASTSAAASASIV